MTPEQFRQVETLFHRGKGLSPEEQRALLDAECGDDTELRAEVEKLLAQADPAETLADLRGKVNRVLRPGVDDPSAAAAGPAIEGYEIIREIHRGGQGVVYQAVQKSTKRKVAIKVLLEGPYASKSARRRFEREIELVAQLKHPNIVSIFHSGQTSDGRQYCVMDYVRGVPLDQYVRNEKLTLEDALKLFAKVCEAVNYAHQKGVIHRDLKPSNILVTPPLTRGGPGGGGDGKDASGTPAGVGDPKVLDFGLAKQLISREASLISLTGQVVGTLPYMSPEQAEGNPDKIDIRTDVYALGVILYQMLTGHYPYPVAGQMAEVLKHIAETEPTPPTRSWKSGTGVTQRTHKRIRPGQCPIDDEVQTIVMRTLAKERERRYQSAGELAKDVGHYLADEPIDAKRDSAFYVIRKQLRRYKLPVAVAAAFVLLLTGATVALSIMYQNQSRARVEAEDARAETQKRVDELQTVTNLQQSMLGDIDAYVMGRAIIDDLRNRIRERLEADKNSPEKVEAAIASFDELAEKINATDAAQTLIDEQILSRAVKMIERDFADKPLLRAFFQQTVAITYCKMGRYEQAMPLLEAALDTRRTELGEEEPDTLMSMYNLATLYSDQGRFEKAEKLCVKTLGKMREVLGEEDTFTLSCMTTLAIAYHKQDHYDQAEPLLVKALDIRRRVLGEKHRDTLGSMNNLAMLYRDQGQYDKAEKLYVKTLGKMREALGEEDTFTLNCMTNLAIAYHKQDHYDQAEPLLVKALDIRRRVLGAEHPDTLGAMINLAILYNKQGRFGEAEDLFVKALEAQRRVLGEEHPDTLSTMDNLATLYMDQGRYDKAEPLFVKTLEARRRVLGEEHRDTLGSMNNLAVLYSDQGQYDQAEPLNVKTLEKMREILGEEDAFTLKCMNNLANLYMGQGRHDQAEPLYVKALEVQRRVLGEEHPDTLNSMNSLAMLYYNQDQYDKAEPLYVKTLEVQRRVLGEEHRDTLGSMTNLGLLYVKMGRLDDAERLLKQSVSIKQRVLGMSDQFTRIAINGLAELYEKLERLDDALPLRRKLLDYQVSQAKRPEATPSELKEAAKALNTIYRLAGLYESQGTYDKAETLYVEALEVHRLVLEGEDRNTLGSMTNLGLLYVKLGRLDDAERLLKQSVTIKQRVLGMNDQFTRIAMNGLAVLYEQQGRLDDALPLRRKLLDYLASQAKRPEATSSELNEAAWALLTNEQEALRNPVAALPIAQRAVEKSGGKDPGILDTLALAYYLTDNVAKAIETEEKALALLPPKRTAVTDGGSVAKQDAASQLRKSLEESLARFRGATSQPTTGPATTQPTSRPTLQPTSRPG